METQHGKAPALLGKRISEIEATLGMPRMRELVFLLKKEGAMGFDLVFYLNLGNFNSKTRQEEK